MVGTAAGFQVDVRDGAATKIELRLQFERRWDTVVLTAAAMVLIGLTVRQCDRGTVEHDHRAKRSTIGAIAWFEPTTTRTAWRNSDCKNAAKHGVCRCSMAWVVTGVPQTVASWARHHRWL